jgi:hypothetical protein
MSRRPLISQSAQLGMNVRFYSSITGNDSSFFSIELNTRTPFVETRYMQYSPLPPDACT